MNTNILYDIYKLNHETEGEDLTVSMAKFQAEHPNTVSHEEAKAMREFMGRHGQALSRAYPGGYEAFAAAVVQGMAEDKTAKEARQ